MYEKTGDMKTSLCLTFMMRSPMILTLVFVTVFYYLSNRTALKADIDSLEFMKDLLENIEPESEEDKQFIVNQKEKFNKELRKLKEDKVYAKRFKRELVKLSEFSNGKEE